MRRRNFDTAERGGGLAKLEFAILSETDFAFISTERRMRTPGLERPSAVMPYFHGDRKQTWHQVSNLRGHLLTASYAT